MTSCILRDVSTKRKRGDDQPIVTTIRLTHGERERLRSIARQDERPVTFLIRQAVAAYLDEREAA